MAADAVNLDTHLAGYIAAKLREFKTYEDGCPSNYASLQDWHKKLDSIIVPLERYSQRFDFEFEVEHEITLAGQQAIKELSTVFPSLWL